MSDSTRICLVGAGRAAKVHANSLVHHVPTATLVAVVDPVPEALQATAEQFGIHARFLTLGEAIQQVDFDAVVITTPTFTHKDLAILAAGAGKHVFLEKPMALNLAECDAIIHSAEQNGVQLQLGFMRRFDPEFVEAAQRIQQQPPE